MQSCSNNQSSSCREKPGRGCISLPPPPGGALLQQRIHSHTISSASPMESHPHNRAGKFLCSLRREMLPTPSPNPKEPAMWNLYRRRGGVTSWWATARRRARPRSPSSRGPRPLEGSLLTDQLLQVTGALQIGDRFFFHGPGPWSRQIRE